eukprot:COSAG05_NODE_757_length_7492_cov_8.402543_3_plen_87_part_00
MCPHTTMRFYSNGLAIKGGPGIATPVGAVSHGVLPLVAGSTLAEPPLWARGALRWAPSLGDLIIPFIQTLPYLSHLYCYLPYNASI